MGQDKLLNAVTFGGANRDAPADYFDGLAPRCQAIDDRQRPLGDPADPLVAAALAWLHDGACPAALAAPKGTDPRANTRPIDAQRPWRGPLDWMGLR